MRQPENPAIWRDATGVSRYIRNMSTDHISNAINYLHRKAPVWKQNDIKTLHLFAIPGPAGGVPKLEAMSIQRYLVAKVPQYPFLLLEHRKRVDPNYRFKSLFAEIESVWNEVGGVSRLSDEAIAALLRAVEPTPLY